MGIFEAKRHFIAIIVGLLLILLCIRVDPIIRPETVQAIILIYGRPFSPDLISANGKLESYQFVYNDSSKIGFFHFFVYTSLDWDGDAPWMLIIMGSKKNKTTIGNNLK